MGKHWGDLTMLLQFSRKDQGVYKAVLSDDKGKDTSVLDISGQGAARVATTGRLLCPTRRLTLFSFHPQCSTTSSTPSPTSQVGSTDSWARGGGAGLTVCVLPSGASASELVLQCTPEGIRLQCYMNYYTEEMKTVWKHK